MSQINKGLKPAAGIWDLLFCDFKKSLAEACFSRERQGIYSQRQIHLSATTSNKNKDVLALE